MPSRARLNWDGEKLATRIRAAATLAVNETVDQAAEEARTGHEWASRTGQLEEEIVTEHATADSAATIVGRFGTTERRGFYGLFHEEGTVHEFERPFLRPAADRVFPSLAARIRRRSAR